MDLLKSGQKLGLFIQHDGNIVEITSTITEVKPDRLVIDLPPYFMRYLKYLEVGCPLTVKVFSKLGTVDFNTIVISSPLEDEFSVELDYNAIKLTPTEEIPSIEDIEELNVTIDETVLQLKTFEIATEYIKFYSDKKFAVNDILECELILPKDYGTINFRATVVEVDPVYDNEYKAVYSNMTEDARGALLYYMYLYSNNSD